MKKYLLSGLALVAILTFSLIPAHAEIQLIFSHTSPAASGIGKLAKAWGDRIEQKSGGEVKFTYYWAGTLVPIAEQVKAIRTGATDVAQIGPFSIVSYMPVSYNIVYLPFMGYPSMLAGTEIWWELYKKFPVMSNEWADVQLLASRMMPPDQIHTTKKMVRVPSDIKGMKLGTSSALMSKLVTLQSGAAVQMPPSDIAMALSTNVVAGWINHFPVTMIFGTLPLYKYHLVAGKDDYAGIAAGMDQLIVNKDKWNKFPADIQKIFIEAGKWYQDEGIKLDMGEIQKAMKIVKDANQQVIYLTPEEMKLWEAAAAPIHEQWIKDMEAKGKNIRPLYDEAKRLIRNYK